MRLARDASPVVNELLSFEADGNDYALRKEVNSFDRLRTDLTP